MPYIKTTWMDEVPATTPVKYKISEAVDGDVASNASIEVVTSLTPGTPVNAANLNKLEDGVETAQAAAEAAQVSADLATSTSIPKSIVTAIGQILYSTASATLAALTKPSATAILQMLSSGVPSWRSIKQTVQVQVVAELADVSGDIAYFFIPSTMDGMVLVRAQAMVLTAGTTGATTIQVRNLTKYASNDALSTAISIASAGTVGTVGTVNTSYDDVSTNDKIKVYVTAQSTTKPKGLIVVLEYQLP